jgi:hypothetical protein
MSSAIMKAFHVPIFDRSRKSKRVHSSSTADYIQLSAADFSFRDITEKLLLALLFELTLTIVTIIYYSRYALPRMAYVRPVV